jgi:hypothetical protein
MENTKEEIYFMAYWHIDSFHTNPLTLKWQSESDERICLNK